MQYFGDTSGDLRSLLNRNCEVYVAGVVGGDIHDCRRCPKRAVDRVDDIPEAKWNDMLDKQKRRMIECFSDSDLEFGYIIIDYSKLHMSGNTHILYDSTGHSTDCDLVFESKAYTQILTNLVTESKPNQIEFIFDRVNTARQSDQVAKCIEKNSNISASFNGSRQEKGIQAADCLAGAVAEEYKRNENWLNTISHERLINCSDPAVEEFGNWLQQQTTDP